MGTPFHGRLVKMLYRRRKDAKLTQTKLAALLSRPQSFVADLESGQRRVDVVEYVALAKALGFDAGSALNELIEAEREDEG